MQLLYRHRRYRQREIKNEIEKELRNLDILKTLSLSLQLCVHPTWGVSFPPNEEAEWPLFPPQSTACVSSSARKPPPTEVSPCVHMYAYMRVCTQTNVQTHAMHHATQQYYASRGIAKAIAFKNDGR